jgi:spore coat protein U-like protein
VNRKNRIILLTLPFFLLILKVEIAISGCTINTSPIRFGNYDSFSSTPSDTAGTITINCSSEVVKATLTLSQSSTSGSFNPRQMKCSGGADLLNYNIYTDVARTIIFGNGTGGTTDIGLKRPTGKPEPWSQIISIYGRIPPGQNVSVGNYSDALTVTIDW